jgi:hypothetical protein
MCGMGTQRRASPALNVGRIRQGRSVALIAEMKMVMSVRVRTTGTSTRARPRRRSPDNLVPPGPQQ